MTQSSLHANAFYREVIEANAVWTIRDAAGFPAPLNGDGKRAQPFWSSRPRAESVIATVPAYANFEAVEIQLDVFLERWITGLGRDGILVGLNWSGARATGYDVEPQVVREGIRSAQLRGRI